jgi:hypothetical protein
VSREVGHDGWVRKAGHTPNSFFTDKRAVTVEKKSILQRGEPEEGR